MESVTQEEWKFMESKQEQQKLRIALVRFFETDSEEWQERYGSYLKKRIRPAVQKLLADGEMEKIEELDGYVKFNLQNLEDFIREAQRQGNVEATVYFLKKKRERFGFKKQDFSF